MSRIANILETVGNVIAIPSRLGGGLMGLVSIPVRSIPNVGNSVADGMINAGQFMVDHPHITTAGVVGTGIGVPMAYNAMTGRGQTNETDPDTSSNTPTLSPDELAYIQHERRKRALAIEYANQRKAQAAQAKAQAYAQAQAQAQAEAQVHNQIQAHAQAYGQIKAQGEV